MDEQSTGRPVVLLDYRALEGQCIKALVAASSSICSWAHKQSTERGRDLLDLRVPASQVFGGQSHKHTEETEWVFLQASGFQWFESSSLTVWSPLNKSGFPWISAPIILQYKSSLFPRDNES